MLGYVRKNISEVEYHTWFAPVKNLGVQEGSLVLGVRNSFAQEWFRKHYLELLEDALRSLGAELDRRADPSAAAVAPERTEVRS